MRRWTTGPLVNAGLCALLLSGCAATGSADQAEARDVKTRRQMDALEKELEAEIAGFGDRLQKAFANDPAMAKEVATSWTSLQTQLGDPLVGFRDQAVENVELNRLHVRASFAQLRAAANNRGHLAEYEALEPATAQGNIDAIFADMIRTASRYEAAETK